MLGGMSRVMLKETILDGLNGGLGGRVVVVVVLLLQRVVVLDVLLESSARLAESLLELVY